MQSIPIAQVIICLNNILTLYEDVKIVQVINFEHNLDFPTIRVASLRNRGEGVIYQKPDMYIINANQSLEINLVSLERHIDFNPRAKFVFLCKDLKESTLKILYYLFIVNVILVNEVDGTIYTYYPFKENKYPGNDFTLVKVGAVTNCSKTNFFENKIPTVWKKSIFSSCFFDAPPYFIDKTVGICPGILHYLFAKEDIEIQWIEDDLTKYEDWTNHFQTELMIGTCDSFLTYFIENVDNLTPHGFEEAYWYIPSPKKLTRWKYVFKIFTSSVWTLWIGTPVVLCIIWCGTLWFKDGIINMTRFVSSLAIISRYFLEQPVVVYFELFSQKILIVNMIFLTYFINIFFKSRFAHLLTFGQITERNTIENFEDIMDRKMDVYVIPNVLYTFDNNKKAQEYFESYLSDVIDDEISLNRTAFDRDLATLTVNKMYLYYKKPLVDEDGRDLVLKLYPPIATFFPNMILKKGQPMMEFLNRKMHRLWDHGFISWVNSKYEIEEKYVYAFSTEGLDIEHIELPLGILVVGLLMSSIIFYFELQEE